LKHPKKTPLRQQIPFAGTVCELVVFEAFDNSKADNTSTIKSSPKRSIGNWLLGIFVAGVGLFALLWVTLPDFFYFNKEELMVVAAKEMVPLEDVFILSDVGENPLSLGMTYYKEGKYQEAIQQYDNYLQRKPNDEEVKLYKAVAQLFGGQLLESMTNLQTLVSSEDSFVVRHSTWYLAIAYLKNKQHRKQKYY